MDTQRKVERATMSLEKQVNVINFAFMSRNLRQNGLCTLGHCLSWEENRVLLLLCSGELSLSQKCMVQVDRISSS